MNKRSRIHNRLEYQFVEEPLVRGLRAIGHTVIPQVKCENGIIDVIDYTDHRIIECKAQGNIHNLGKAYNQLLKYRDSFITVDPIFEIAIAVPQIEEEAKPLADLLIKNDVKIIQTRARYLHWPEQKCPVCDQIMLMMGDDIHRHVADEWALSNLSGELWSAYIINKAWSLSEREVDVIKAHECFNRIQYCHDRYLFLESSPPPLNWFKKLKMAWNLTDQDMMDIYNDKGSDDEVARELGYGFADDTVYLIRMSVKQKLEFQ
jgi:hypothetical protein